MNASVLAARLAILTWIAVLAMMIASLWLWDWRWLATGGILILPALLLSAAALPDNPKRSREDAAKWN